jgi:hypothetical protein
MITVNVHNGELTPEERKAYIARAHELYKAYIARAHELYPGKAIESIDITIDITLDGEYADITYNFAPVRFQRIRRITGYLVGTLDRFNNAKRCEERDRVKHDLTDTKEDKDG